MITDPTRAIEWMIGLGPAGFLGCEDGPAGEAVVHVETALSRVGCPDCGTLARVKDRDEVTLVDLPLYGRRARTVWHKRRWCCPDTDCPRGSWTECDEAIAAPRQALTSRAARWATEQVGRCGRSVTEVAAEVGCDWHTVNDAVVAYGEALLEADTERIGKVRALGLDETLMARLGSFRRQCFTTQLVDVKAGRLLDVVPGRDSMGPTAWLEAQGKEFTDAIDVVTLDLSGPYRKVAEKVLPHATKVADPFHLVKLANTKLDECRRRTQQDVLGHRGRKDDPLYRCRRLLTKAKERLDEKGSKKLAGLLRAGDPRGDVGTLYTAKEAVCCPPLSMSTKTT